VQQLVKQGKLNGVDLIIGPLYGKVFAEVEKFAHTNCIPLVSPTLKGNEIVDKNDYVLKLVPSDETMVYAIGRYVSQSDSTKNLVLHYGAADEQRLLWRFRQGLEADGMKPANFPAVNMNRSSRDSLRTVLSRKTRNNLIILSNNEARLASLLRTMTNWTEESYIVGFAPNAWQTFKNVEMDYFDHFRLHIPTPFFVDYERIDVQLFVQRFRNTFKTDPSTFAFRGYDLAMHLIPNLNGIMESGPSYLESVQESGLQSDFRWIRVPNGGLENAAPRMVDYTGYELKLATD
jgi:ABC-type branched-subunit amino acid transport system substrate-binding protein